MRQQHLALQDWIEETYIHIPAHGSPQIILPIFSGGSDIAVAGYEKTIQTAFNEVSDALAALDTLRSEATAQRALVQSSQKALSLSQARYRGGVDN